MRPKLTGGSPLDAALDADVEDVDDTFAQLIVAAVAECCGDAGTCDEEEDGDGDASEDSADEEPARCGLFGTPGVWGTLLIPLAPPLLSSSQKKSGVRRKLIMKR